MLIILGLHVRPQVEIQVSSPKSHKYIHPHIREHTDEEQREESGWDGRREKEGAGIQTAHFPLGSIRPSHYGGWAKQIGNGWSRLHCRVLPAFQTLTKLYNSFGGKAKELERGSLSRLVQFCWFSTRLYRSSSRDFFFLTELFKGWGGARKSWHDQQLQ